MKTLNGFWMPALCLVLAACSDDSSGGGGGAGNSGGGGKLTNAQCSEICLNKATACMAPGDLGNQICASVCQEGVTQGQADCLNSKPCSELSTISSASGFKQVCPAEGSGGSGGSGGSSGGAKFGDPCKCKEDSSEGSGEFLCSGTGICSDGLSCVGSRTQGVDNGKCVGPTCCSGEADCNAKLGKQGSCASGQVCACPFGDFECVGDKCTCGSGAAPSKGLCHKN